MAPEKRKRDYQIYDATRPFKDLRALDTPEGTTGDQKEKDRPEGEPGGMKG